MPRIDVNMDCGEGRAGWQRDMRLLPLVDQVNIAVGGHAGDPARAQALARLAQQHGVRVCLHPGLPDRSRFGRVWYDLPWWQLRQSLDQQRAVLPQADICKFHGALYNRAMDDADLAQALVDWCLAQGFKCLLSLTDGQLAIRARACGIDVMAEGFADRNYEAGPVGYRLKPRDSGDAVLHRSVEIADRLRHWMVSGALELAGQPVTFPVDTWCIHGDGPVAEQALSQLRKLGAHA